MKLYVAKNFTELFPSSIIGIVYGSINKIKVEFDEVIENMRKDAEDSLMRRNLDTSTLSRHPHIAAWRTAYCKFGVKAKKHKPTHEALVRRILKGGGWPDINPLVDLYLVNQVEHILPHGGYDADRIVGDLHLARTTQEEPFMALGGQTETTAIGEVIYQDERGVLTRRWNYRDCDRTKITENTKRFILMIESPSAEINKSEILKAVEGLKEKINSVFSGRLSSTIIDVGEGDTKIELSDD